MIKPYPQFHTMVDDVSKTLYQSGHFTEALRSASTKLEEYCKEISISLLGSDEYSGQRLVYKLFWYEKKKQDGSEVISPPLIAFYNLATIDGKSKQESMCKMYSGFVGVIRNQLAHCTVPLNDIEALYGLNIASYLFYKLEEAYSANKILVDEEPKITDALELNARDINKIIKLVDEEEKFKNINIADLYNAKLAIKSALDALIIDNLDTLGAEVYNSYNSSQKNPEKIIGIIIEKIYATKK